MPEVSGGIYSSAGVCRIRRVSASTCSGSPPEGRPASGRASPCGAGLFGRQRDLAGMAVPGFGFVSVGLVLFRCFVLVEVGLHGGIVLFVGMIMRTRAVAGDQRQGAEQGHKGSRFHGFLSIVFLFPGQR